MLENLIKGEFSDRETEQLLSRTAEIKARLLGNVFQLEQYPEPILLVGESYPGIWLEHNQDNLFLAEYAPEAAWASQAIFMDYQREDGLLPFALPWLERAGYFQAAAAYWHVQSVYPFVRCAREVARSTGRPESDLRRIYDAGKRYDHWFVRNRNRSGSGLVEMYCEFDTGHDNSPRVTEGGIPDTCPGKDAVNMPDIPVMPILSVDLSAMLYGSRTALAELAEELGISGEAALWREKAEELKMKIKTLLHDPEDEFYYDRDRNGLRKYRTEHITRLFLNGVLDQEEFNRIYTRYFENSLEFQTPYPYPSVSISDPSYVKNAAPNSWGAHTQALTSLRAVLWLQKYGREQDRTALLLRWMRAFLIYDTHFPQELNPFTGAPIGDGHNYTPSLLLFLEGAKALQAECRRKQIA